MAQKRVPGYYISSKGDTISGSFTEFSEWNFNPSHVKFEGNTNESHVLTVENCKSFAVNGYDQYESIQLSRMTNSIELNGNYEMEGAEAFENIKVFGRIIYNNNGLRLIEFKDKKRENYFYQKDNGAITELVFRVYLSDGKVVDDKRYLKQLQALFVSHLQKDKKLAQGLPRLQYTEEDLVSFVNQVHNEKVLKNARKYPSELVLIGGASFNSFKVTPRNVFLTQSTTSYNSVLSPIIGFGIINYSQRNFGKNIYAVQIKNYSFKNKGIADNKVSYEYKANVTMVGVNFGRKWINKPNLSWYTSFAPSAVFLLGNTETRVSGEQKKVVKGRFLAHIVGLQTGVVFQRFGIWGLYNIGTVNTHTYVQVGTRHRSLQAGIDWKLKYKSKTQ
jgi:hypothetical protein